MEQFRNLGIFDNIIFCREAFRRILNIPNEIYIDYKPHISTKFINRNIPHSQFISLIVFSIYQFWDITKKTKIEIK